MRFEVTLTAEADSISSQHLLQHYQQEKTIPQEDLCFALWRPSTGEKRRTALIDEIILPEEGERLLHGNASFQPDYLARALKIAREKGTGLAFMHSHLTPGWQGMSSADVEAERDVLAYPAGATGLPLLGLTIGTDGYWSARSWERDGAKMRRNWCEKIRVIDPQSYKVYFNDRIAPVPRRRRVLTRTYDTWGQETQNTISRLRVGIVGLGSVGCIVAETMARIGITQVTLIDPDRVEEHNLDRLIYATAKDIGELKVDLAARAMKHNATAEGFQVIALPVSVHHRAGYKAALDCDILFSCVDRPVPRDVLNYIANAHLIPVIDGGVAVETNEQEGNHFFSAHWRAHIVTPYHQCLRCNRQYNSSTVIMELDGSLDDPSYVRNLPADERTGNQNVFPFCLGVAGTEVNLMLRYLLAPEWWPRVQQLEHQFVTGETRAGNFECHVNCSFRERRAQGDTVEPFYLTEDPPVPRRRTMWQRLLKFFDIGYLKRKYQDL